MSALDEAAGLARLASLERRVAHLEMLCFGRARSAPSPDEVVSLYVDAQIALMQEEPPDAAARGWAHAFMTLTEDAVLQLARRADDPHPWVPFLQLTIYLRRDDDHDDHALAAAEIHLRRLAKTMLESQGLGIVQPDDLLARPVRAVPEDECA